MKLNILDDTFAICRLAPNTPLPPWSQLGLFTSITRTQDELSIICPAQNVPADVVQETDWACLQIQGQLDFSLTGILSELISPLAKAQISIFAQSTYNTDYILVRNQDLKRAIQILLNEGYDIQ